MLIKMFNDLFVKMGLNKWCRKHIDKIQSIGKIETQELTKKPLYSCSGLQPW